MGVALSRDATPSTREDCVESEPQPEPEPEPDKGALSDDSGDAFMAKLAQLTTQNLQTTTSMNTAVTEQAALTEELGQIDKSVTAAAKSAYRVNASATATL